MPTSPERKIDDNPPPEGECTCTPDAAQACDYCHAMNLWSVIELYGHEDSDCGDENRREWDWDEEDDE